MSNTINRRRMRNKYGNDVFYGETESEKAKTYSSLLSTLAQAGGEIASTQLKAKEAAAKAAAEKEANKDRDAAVAAAKEARKRAAMAAAEAQGEANPKGPLHQAAQKAESDARVAEAKAAYYTPSPSPAQMTEFAPKKSSGIPTWVWWAMGGLGVVGVGALGYKLLKRKRG